MAVNLLKPAFLLIIKKNPFSSISFSSISFYYPKSFRLSLPSLSLLRLRDPIVVVGKDSVKEILQEEKKHNHNHPYAFHVSGPRNFSSPNWREFFSSSWKDDNYRRTVLSCFIQAAYLLEIDRQENRTEKTSLALNWWQPFKYKVTQTLVDQRDGSIFGALLEWDTSAALSDFIFMRPSGAPKVILALRGTLLTSPTMRRDIEDDLRFVAWESLESSVRFGTTLEALKSVIDRFGSHNVCITGHSLGAGFALEVGKALAKQGIFVESHLFNPPSVSIALSLRSIGEKAELTWRRFKSMVSSRVETQTNNDETPSIGDMIREIWAPHLYVNNSDYICCNYHEPAGTSTVDALKKEKVVAKLFVMSKGKNFIEAHGLQQWWSEDLELESVLNSSKLICRQLKSLYTLQPSPPIESSINNNRSWVQFTKKAIILIAWPSIVLRYLGGMLWSITPRRIFF